MHILVKVWKALRVLCSGDSHWFHALLSGVAPGLNHLNVLASMQPESVVDIGANRGQFALAVRHCHANVQIYSFEPLPEPAGVLARVFAGDQKLCLHEVAVGPEAGMMTMHVSAHDDSSSLLPIGAEQDRLFPGTAESHTQSIRVGPLREFITEREIVSPALLKLDVQGYELSSLRGCEDLLRCFEWIYAECSFIELYEGQALADEVIAWLRERGFLITGVYNMTNNEQGRAIQADFLFMRRGGQGHIP